MSVLIVLPATVVELSSASLKTNKIPRARIRVDGADDFLRDLSVMNLVGLKLDQKLKVTISQDEADVT